MSDNCRKFKIVRSPASARGFPLEGAYLLLPIYTIYNYYYRTTVINLAGI